MSQAPQKAAQKPPKEPDVIFVPTPQEVVDKMLELAEVKKGDLVYDLGCGDGRIVVTAAKKYGVKAVGYDVDPERIKESNDNVKKNNVGNLVREHQHYQGPFHPDRGTAVWHHHYDELNQRTGTTRPDGHRVEWLTYGAGHVHGLLLDGQDLVSFERDALKISAPE